MNETTPSPAVDPAPLDLSKVEPLPDPAAAGSEARSGDADLAPEATDPTTWVESLQQSLAPLGDLVGNGGPVLIILVALSVIALTIVLAKLYQFARLRLNAREPVATALACWSRGDAEAALRALGHDRQPRARLLAQAVTGLRQVKDQPAAAMELLREELTRAASAQLEQLRAWLRALEVIAALSPLLGLLGTVLGMIEAFRQLELAGSQVDPAILSGGIWQALLTTAAGLSVAIPVVLLHSWLERRVERCAHGMEDAVTRLFTHAVRPMSAAAWSWSAETDAVAAAPASTPDPDAISESDPESASARARPSARADGHRLTKPALGDAA
ncbi:MAG: MotA/TolQ/ExbB proton channel family protein [Halochromatium sp.]